MSSNLIRTAPCFYQSLTHMVFMPLDTDAELKGIARAAVVIGTMIASAVAVLIRKFI
jgi:hypothetical protein